MILNYVQQIFPGGAKHFVGALPLCGPWLRVW